MNNRRWVLGLAAILLLSGFDPLRGADETVEEGNAQLGAGKTEEALKYYDQAAKKLPDRPEVQYNRGIALHRLGRDDDAMQAFKKGTQSGDPQAKQRSFFNLGNVQMKQKKYGEAVDSYRQALRLNPQDGKSRWNLEVALKQKQKHDEEQKKNDQQQKEQQKNDQQQNDQQKNDKSNSDQQQGKNDPKSPEQKQEQQQPRDEQAKNEPDQQNKSDEKPTSSPNEPSKEKPTAEQREINQALDALDQSEKNVQRERARILYPDRRQPEKDW